MTSVLSRRSTATSKKRWRVARGAWSDTHHCPKVSLTLLGLAKKARKRLKKKKENAVTGRETRNKGLADPLRELLGTTKEKGVVED